MAAEGEQGKEGAAHQALDYCKGLVGFGRQVLVKAKADQDSIARPGIKSVISEPMDQFCTYEQFFDQFIQWWRYPVFPIEECTFLKSCECIDLGPSEFEVKVLYDADKMRRWGMNVDTKGDTMVRTHYRCWYNFEEMWFKNQDLGHNLEDPKVQGGSEIHFHKDPLRLEFWITLDPEGEQTHGGPLMAKYAQDFFINPFILRIQRKEFSVESEVESPTDEGQLSVISDPLDELINYDEVFEYLLDSMKSPYAGKNASITSKNDKEWVCRLLNEPNGNSLHIRADRETGKIRGTFLQPEKKKGAEPEVLMRHYYYMHQQPLRVESYWVLKDGERLASRSVAGQLQTVLDQSIRALEGGWFY